MKKLGIIGYGSFGKFAAKSLAGSFDIKAYDPNSDVPKEIRASLGQVCEADYVMLAIPLSVYNTLLESIKNTISSDTIIVDVSSVKVEPLRLISRHLDSAQKYVMMHPLFGPESASDSLTGYKVVICESSVSDNELSKIKKFINNLGLNIIEISSDDHDQQMATVQALTFFLARTLNEFGLHDMQFQTPSFQRLLDLASLDKKHSAELLQTIWSGNKYSATVRKKFINEMTKLDNEIK